jgi:hypothetical protein
MVTAIVVLLMLAAAPPVFAGQPLPTPRPTARFGALRPAPSKDPYRQLFEAKALKKAVENAAPKADRQPSVVCGMTIVPADRSIDPKMLFPRKADGADYKIRVLTPPICHSPK